MILLPAGGEGKTASASLPFLEVAAELLGAAWPPGVRICVWLARSPVCRTGLDGVVDTGDTGALRADTAWSGL